MRLLLALLVWVSFSGCSGLVLYEPENYSSLPNYQTDSLIIDAEFNNSYIYPNLLLNCNLPVSQLGKIKELSLALKRTKNGQPIPCDSISIYFTSDSGRVMPVAGNSLPATLPDSMLTPSGQIRLTIENHYISITDNPEYWYMQLITHTSSRKLDSVYTYKATKSGPVIRFH